MAQTEAEKKAYMRGYNRRNSRDSGRVWRILKVAKAIRDRQHSTDANLCKNCERWTRGGPNCLWGVCSTDFQYGVEPRMWPDTYPTQTPAKITTTEDFGCVSWLPRQSAPVSPSCHGNEEVR